jgi:hypothetical protein
MMTRELLQVVQQYHDGLICFVELRDWLTQQIVTCPHEWVQSDLVEHRHCAKCGLTEPDWNAGKF